MERLSANRGPAGISAVALRTWGLIFLAAGVLGRGLIQNLMLDIPNSDMQAVFQAMSESESVMGMVTVSLVLQAMESCAVPIYAFLLVEGFQRTSDYKKYLIRVIGVALVSEFLYNFVMNGSVIAMDTRNPVWGTVLSLVLLGLLRYVDEKLKGSKAMKIIIGLAGILWAKMLSVDYGIFFVAMVLALWSMRNKPQYCLFLGMAAAALCSVISPFYLASTMGFMAIHFYNGEQGESSRIFHYVAYPAMLLLCALVPMFL